MSGIKGGFLLWRKQCLNLPVRASAMPQTIAQAAPQNHVLNLLTSGELHSHLADVEEEAQSLFLQLVKQYAEQEGLTEQLKATNQMEWVQRMKNIQERVKEIIDKNLMF